jgi:HAD superfamily hydrolase (TIGR01450 family)
MSFANGAAALERLKAARCFVLDMDGTFYLGDRLLPGSLGFLNAARASGRRALFLTNNSSRDGEYYLKKLRGMGCNVTDGDVYTSGMATCRYLNRTMRGGKVFLLGNEYLRSEFMKYGVPLSQDDPGIVVVGYDTSLDYEKLSRACTLVRTGMPYIATHPDLNCPTAEGFVPDIGAIIAFVQASTGRLPDTIVGKPYGEIVQGMLELTGLAAEELCICGDRLYTDIATGINNGMLAVCVLSGEATLEDIEKSPVKPDLVFNSLADMIEYL